MERWLPVPGYEGWYSVSDQGRVRNARTGRLMAQSSAQEYLRVHLCREGNVRYHKVHQLVAAAFLGPCPPGMEPCHGPGGRLDNRLENLSYGTHAENLRQRRRDGTDAGGPKLTSDVVRECRRRYRDGERIAVLAAEYGVRLEHMRLVVTGRRWQHVQ